jgi:3-dehydroquinate synthase
MKRLSEIKLWFPKATKVALVADSNVERLYADRAARELESAGGITVERLSFPAGEGSKNLDTYTKLISALATLGFSRSDVIVALGGGVTGDLAGFAAATYMRGIPFVQVPTTLLAMVDSSIGGKTGVDIPEGKNLAGAFHLPEKIIRDYSFLETLDRTQLNNGFAEMIKTAVLFDRELFEVLKRKPAGEELFAAIERTAGWKEKIVDEDFREGGRRMLLNLGHTLAHALEKVSNFQVPHGEAVAVGMRAVSKRVPEVGEILDIYGLGDISSLDAYASRDELAAAMFYDKKRSGGKITLVVPYAVGDCRLEQVYVENVWEWMQ